MNVTQFDLEKKIQIIKNILELFLEIIIALKPILENKIYKADIKKKGTLHKLANLFEEVSELCKGFGFPFISDEFLEDLKN